MQHDVRYTKVCSTDMTMHAQTCTHKHAHTHVRFQIKRDDTLAFVAAVRPEVACLLPVGALAASDAMMKPLAAATTSYTQQCIRSVRDLRLTECRLAGLRLNRQVD